MGDLRLYPVMMKAYRAQKAYKARYEDPVMGTSEGNETLTNKEQKKQLNKSRR